MATEPRHTLFIKTEQRYLFFVVVVCCFCFAFLAMSAFVKPYTSHGVNFGPDCTLEYVRQDFGFTITWPNFVVSEEENLMRVGAVALPTYVAYPIGGDLDAVSYFEGLPKEERGGWFQFEVCGSPAGYPAYYNFDTSAAIDGQTGTRGPYI